MTRQPSKTTLNKGHEAEQAACLFLQKQGLQLVTQNYRCRMGEIDLIMKDADSLVFIEVRLRNNQNFGGALASVTTKKQEKLRLTALHYLQQHAPNISARFDVVAIHNATSVPQIDWIKNAF